MNGRRSHPFPPVSHVWIRSRETRFLLEDFDNRVVPSRHKPVPYDLAVQGIPSHEIDEALTLSDQSHGLEGFIQTVATRLLSHHEIWLEIALVNQGNQRAPFRVFEVGNVKRSKTGTLMQEPPNPEELPPWYTVGDDPLLPIELDSQAMVHTTLPDAYPSRLLRRVIRDLSGVNADIAPDWVMEQWVSQGTSTIPFDVSEVSRTEKLRIAQAALPIGWPGRGIRLGLDRQVTEYYYFLRELRFLRFVASMRARAEEALCEVLARASQACGFTASVTAQGIYTPGEVDVLIEQFAAGELTFSAVLDIMREEAKGDAPAKRREVCP